MMSSSSASICWVPSRQSTHLPQLSRWVNSMKKRAMPTMQVLLFIATRPPEPTIAPTPRSESKSSGRSRCSRVRQPPEGPPICTALKPSRVTLPRRSVMPPPMLKTISRSVVPKGTSISPVLATWPVRAKVLVPGEAAVPSLRNCSAPSLMMRTACASVSTLLMMVGLPHRPLWAGNGGLGRGMPRCPSIEAIIAVSSPQTKAPAPSITSQRSGRPEPKTLSPRKPRASASSTARAHALHGQRVLGAHVDQRLVGADRARGDHQPLEHAVRIAFHHAAVHERARVALVGVADDVFLALGLRRGPLPTCARWGSRRRRGRAGPSG